MSSFRMPFTRGPQTIGAFTLVEMMVSMAVLALLVAIIGQLFRSATIVTTQGNKRMDADAQAREMLDRMAIDFAQMVKRADVSYYLKSAATPQTDSNDQIAFYSEVPGYSSGSPTSVSLVSYRINSTPLRLERLGKNLIWNGATGTGTPLVFLPLTIAATWPAATDASADADYETVGTQVFRFEYYYVLNGQDSTSSSVLSVTPWDTRAPLSHTGEAGLRDVAAIGVVIAVVDPKSRVLLTDSQLAALGDQMDDFRASMAPEIGRAHV